MKIQNAFVTGICVGVFLVITQSGRAQNFYATDSGYNNSGVYHAYQSGNTSTATTYFETAYTSSGIALDSSGNVYMSDNGGYINKYSPTGQYISTVADLSSVSRTPGNTPLAFDSLGDLYIGFGNRIFKVDTMGSISPYLFVNYTIQGLAIDKSDNLYVSDGTDNLIYQYNNGNLFSPSSVHTGNNPVGLTFNDLGNLFVANNSDNTIFEYAITNDIFSSPTTFAQGLNDPYGLAFDDAGNLLESEPNGAAINELNSNGNIINTYTSNLTLAPAFIAVVPEPTVWAMLCLSVVGGTLRLYRKIT